MSLINFPASPHHRLTLDTLLSSVWHFSHASGLLGCEALRLLADQTVGGYVSPNENGWKLLNGQLAFLHVSGAVSTVFDRMARLDDGNIELRGAFLLESSVQVTLVLRQVPDTFRREVPSLMRDIFVRHIEVAGWEIGDHSYGHPSIVILEPWRLIVGRYCSFAQGVVMVASNHRTDMISTYPFAVLNHAWRSVPRGTSDHVTRGNIVIGSDVWIGSNAFIGSGITVGHGAVIGAMSVVTRDVPPYAVVGGNPARVIRFRFTPETIERLLLLRWWDWSDAKVEAFLPLMLSNEMERFLEAAADCARPVYEVETPIARTSSGSPT
jgi:acetyltransferase-like isoleucine patch superfamily enzyme